MKIVDFEKKYVEEAKVIALANYYEEKLMVAELPRVQDVPDLNEFAENGLGVVALEDDKVVGFWGCYRPWEGAFGSAAKGTFSPIHAHGAVAESREMVYRKMYQAAARKWVARGITYHAIALYAHDDKALRTLFMYGFGVRCVDAVRSVKEVSCKPQPDLVCRELPKEEIEKIREMRRMLSEHLGDSPCFMYSRRQEFENWLVRAEARASQVYVAEMSGMPVAFVEVMADGENFVTEIPGMKNICGAFCLPKYRGNGVFANLMDYVNRQLREQKVELLGVDYESFNPTASGAWLKYFTPYTHSVVRRIDECALHAFQPLVGKEKFSKSTNIPL